MKKTKSQEKYDALIQYVNIITLNPISKNTLIRHIDELVSAILIDTGKEDL